MRNRVGLLWVLVAIALAGSMAGAAPSARADGDPGSDVLVYQDLFVGSDAGLSVAQQVELGDLLAASSRAGVPIRVAIVAHPDDLGSISALWLEPQAYARFLGIELSLSYTGRLLVVMPNGFGLNWPGHATAAAYRSLAGIPVGSGADRLLTATRSAVARLATAAGRTLRISRNASSGALGPTAAGEGSPASAAGTGSVTSTSSGGGGVSAAIIVAAVLLLAAVAFKARALRGRRPRATAGVRLMPLLPHWALPTAAASAALLLAGVIKIGDRRPLQNALGTAARTRPSPIRRGVSGQLAPCRSRAPRQPQRRGRLQRVD